MVSNEPLKYRAAVVHIRIRYFLREIAISRNSLINYLTSNSLTSYTENENEKDNQADVIEHSENEISKENSKRRCKKQTIPISSSKSQENSCVTTLNENDQVILLIFVKILRGFDFTEKEI